ncbi:MAG: hypothetical protein AAFW95_06470 [Cyanobacteria bacterium J06638_6]
MKPIKLLGRLIEATAEEFGLETRSLGARTCDRSLALPCLKASDMVQFLELRFPKQASPPAAGENSVVRQFRQWGK